MGLQKTDQKFFDSSCFPCPPDPSSRMAALCLRLSFCPEMGRRMGERNTEGKRETMERGTIDKEEKQKMDFTTEDTENTENGQRNDIVGGGRFWNQSHEPISASHNRAAITPKCHSGMLSVGIQGTWLITGRHRHDETRGTLICVAPSSLVGGTQIQRSPLLSRITLTEMSDLCISR